MIIASIDLMNGKAVQLRRGKEHVLTSEKDPVELAKEFSRYAEVTVIDLDSALGKGGNLETIRNILKHVDVRVGGGIRDIKRADELLRAGASSIIIGTMASKEFLSKLPKERVIVALDHIDGKVVDDGWQRNTNESVTERAKILKGHCNGFLITFVKNEGTMQGFDLEKALEFNSVIDAPITFAGGAKDTEEVVKISRKGLDIQVGLGLYSGKIDLIASVVESIDFEKSSLIPTIVQDEDSRVLMLAYSSKESLSTALKEGKGIYFSRSRNQIWEKGSTSGNTQQLISVRTDCDRDSLIFRVKQKENACHKGRYSCFGNKKFTLNDLYRVLEERKKDMPEGSYSAKLFSDRKYLYDKIIEEANEVITAKKRSDHIWEIADIFYMLSVLAVDEGIDLSEIIAELGGRHR